MDIFLCVFQAPEGRTENSPGLQPWEDGPERNRPERAAEGRSLFPKITFVESDSMAFQKLTKLFLIRKFAVMLGLIGNVGGTASTLDSLTEKAPYPFCQAKPRTPFSLSRFEDEPLTRPIISAKAIFFDKEERMWT